jgi:hypothetical protein
VEIEASWRDSRHGEKLFIEKKSSWRGSLRGETSPWREALRGERLQGETLYMERTAKERGFVERLSPGRTWPASSCRLVHISHIKLISLSWFTSSSSLLMHLCNLASPTYVGRGFRAFASSAVVTAARLVTEAASRPGSRKPDIKWLPFDAPFGKTLLLEEGEHFKSPTSSGYSHGSTFSPALTRSPFPEYTCIATPDLLHKTCANPRLK